MHFLNISSESELAVTESDVISRFRLSLGCINPTILSYRLSMTLKGLAWQHSPQNQTGVSWRKCSDCMGGQHTLSLCVLWPGSFCSSMAAQWCLTQHRSTAKPRSTPEQLRNCMAMKCAKLYRATMKGKKGCSCLMQTPLLACGNFTPLYQTC